MVDTFLSLHDHGRMSVPAFRYWIHGFTLQTLVYGINVVLFLMSIWVLTIHIMKGSTHRFHKYHQFQNTILLLYVVGMFALSSVLMGHQGVVAGDAWSQFLNVQSGDSAEDVVQQVFDDQVPLRRACNAILVLVNWGTVALLVGPPAPDFARIESENSLSYGGAFFTGRSVQYFPAKPWRFLI
jgi:hypothetical protein